MRPNPAGPRGVRPFSAVGAVRPFKCRLAGPDRLRGWRGGQGWGSGLGGGGSRSTSPQRLSSLALSSTYLYYFLRLPILTPRSLRPQCPQNSSLHPNLSLVSLSGAATPAMGQEWGKVASGSEPAPRSLQRAPAAASQKEVTPRDNKD